MATWIKAGFWEKLCKPCKGYKGWLNLDQFVKDNALPYKVYTALLTQEGTNPPVATVFENTIGNITWTRPISDGIYVANLAGAFTANKTYINCWLNYSTCAAVFANCSLQTGVTQEDECFFYTYSDLSSTLFDLGGDGLFVEIRVYP